MGWLYSHISRSALIHMLIKTETTEDIHRETLRHTLCGNVLWSVVRITDKKALPDTAFGQPVTLICCYLLQRSGEVWGYKSLCEADGPCYYTCPLSYLDLTPVRSEQWREAVKAYHHDRKERRNNRRSRV